MKSILSLLLTISAVLLPRVSHSETAIKPASPVFRFHVPVEPASLDPVLVQSSDASYFLNNVMRGLYSYSNNSGLTLEDAKNCRWVSSLKIACELRPDTKWSDGSPIIAADYVRSFRRLIGPRSKSAAIDLLKNLQHAMDIHGGSAASSELGIRSVDANRLEFTFEKSDPDFLFKLASSVLVPAKSDVYPLKEKAQDTIVNGPYKVKSWMPGRRARLEPNPFYKRGQSLRPSVEVLFVDDDETAYNLYEQGELTLLRRLPTSAIPKSKARKDFLQIPMARFDYYGFGPELRDQPALREALAYSANFSELKTIYDALGMPGCPSLPRHLMNEEPCISFDLARAKAAFAKVPSEIKSKRFKISFSNMGGDDIKRGAEWFQAQWKKNLGLTIDIESNEQRVHLAKLRTAPPAIFRKGIGLDRPTCLAALETFATGGSENFVKFQNDAYDEVVKKLSLNPSEAARKKLCTDGIKILISENRLIPLGRIHFTLLARPEFHGWSLNEMNQLDLANLRYDH